MDLLDEKLIELLGKDARQSSEELAKQLNVSAATIRRRVGKLLESEIVRIVGVVDPKKMGYNLAAIMTIDIAHNAINAALKMLSDRKGVSWVSTNTGRHDIIILAHFRSTDDLAEFIGTINSIKGLKGSETFVSLHIAKGNYMYWV